MIDFKVYGYRWVMLGVYMFITAVNQLLWITFAPITSDATQFYGVSDLKIGILSMCFMVVYLIVSIPASYFIDTYGIRAGVGVGVAFTGIFGLLRGLVPSSYTMILVSQIGIAIGQPFILNAITKVAARWFPIKERATASGLGTLAMYLGILIAMILTPFLVNWAGIDGMLTTYGVVSAVAAVAFFVLAKERPLTPPCHIYQEERALAIDGLKLIFRRKDFNWLMFIFFVGLGVFNAVTTWIENIVYPRGFSSEQAGITGGLMIVGGLIGAVVIPMLSDHYKKRIPFIIIALAGATISLAGIAFATAILVTSGFRRGIRIFPAQLRSHRVPVRCRGNLSGLRRNFKRIPAAHGADLGYCIYFRDGQFQICRYRINDKAVDLNDRFNGFKLPGHTEAERIIISEQTG